MNKNPHLPDHPCITHQPLPLLGASCSDNGESHRNKKLQWWLRHAGQRLLSLVLSNAELSLLSEIKNRMDCILFWVKTKKTERLIVELLPIFLPIWKRYSWLLEKKEPHIHLFFFSFFLFFFFTLFTFISFFIKKSEYVVVISFVNGEVTIFFFLFFLKLHGEVTFTSNYNLAKKPPTAYYYFFYYKC